MRAIEDKRVDQFVVYKIDRLTRSLSDFAKIVDVLGAADTSFVSVTQSFNTATSMGRLTLNMLLSFAQFEREVTAERIRDKIAASKKKGLWMGGSVPLGYRPNGRTLVIDETEAATIRTIYELYETHKTVCEVAGRANTLGLRTRIRTCTDGRTKGGKPFARGHIYAILTNPIYAGLIRHKDKVYDGQHPAIIELETWDHVQRLLETGAAKGRGSKQLADPSPLIGKLYDDTGDRLTPSHSRKNGKRLRYYISRCLVVDRRAKHPDAWRLPAEQLEYLVAELVRGHLGNPTVATELLSQASVSQLIKANKLLSANRHAASWLKLVARIGLQSGSITATLDQARLSDFLDCKPENLNLDALAITAPFRMRRRGVELKLHLGDAPAEIDGTLVRNIVTAQRWLRMIIKGKSLAEIATEEGTTSHRIRMVTDLALLAPDILDAIASGTQPEGLNTDRLIKSDIPANWVEQRNIFAKT